MADETTAPEAESPDTPAQETPDSPQGTPESTPDTDWEQRYKDLQSEYTRTSQKASELEQYGQLVNALRSPDPQVAQQALDALGLEFADTETPEPGETGEPQGDPRLDEVWDFVQQQQSQQFEQAQAAAAYEAIEDALKADGREPGGAEDPATRLMFDRTFELVMAGVDPAAAARETVGLIDQMRQAERERHDQQWAATKRSSVPASGQEAVETPSLDSHADRVAHMTERVLANERQ